MHNQNKVVIVASKRTPIGQLQGCFAQYSAPQLASIAIKATLAQVDIDLKDINELFMGCVLSAGIGQAPARQAALAAGLPVAIGATTINKMCGSGMKALMLAHDLIQAGNDVITLAGGMESMSNAPYLLAKARQGYRLGHSILYDHLLLDGLEDAYDKGTLMGVFAEKCASHYHFSRQVQDDFAQESLKRAQRAQQQGLFEAEIAPVCIETRSKSMAITIDELPTTARLEKISTLKPAFVKQGTVTAANSSSISDGACIHLLMKGSQATKLSVPPLATIIGHAAHAQEPAWFTTAPILAIKKLLHKISWKIQDVDLFEINEAFAVVTLVAMQELNIPLNKVNVHGGACALGHPIGASGARIVTTLLYALQRYGLKRGIAALCIGGGEATAIAIEVDG